MSLNDMTFYSPCATGLNLYTCIMTKNAFGIPSPTVGFSITPRFRSLHDSLLIRIDTFEIVFGDDEEYRPFIPETMVWIQKNQDALLKHWNGEAVLKFSITDYLGRV